MKQNKSSVLSCQTWLTSLPILQNQIQCLSCTGRQESSSKSECHHHEWQWKRL